MPVRPRRPVEWNRVGRRREREQGEAATSHLVEGAHPGPGHRERVADRDAHAAAVERIGALRVEQHGVDPERRRVAEQDAEVLVVVEPLDHRDPSGPVEQRARPPAAASARPTRPRPDAGRSRRPAATLVFCDVHGSVDALEHVGQDRVLRGGDEHGSHGSTRFHERPHDERRLGDEEPLLGLDPAPQRRIREPEVVGEPRIVGVGDANDGRSDGTGSTVPAPAGTHPAPRISRKTLKNPRQIPASAAATCNDAPRTSPAVDGGHL